MSRIAISIMAMSVFLCCVCCSQEVGPRNDSAWKQISSWREPMPKVTVVNGCELVIDGIRCRLFGVRLPEDAALAGRAKRFLELYMKGYGDDFGVYNTDSPVNSKDGIPLIWLRGYGNGGWAQETLVQAGLLQIDYSGFEDYHFKVPMKVGFQDFDWKKCLSDAQSEYQAGKKPNINFEWPEVVKK